MKNLLKPTGYAVVFIPFYGFGEWCEYFQREGFQIIHHPYVVIFHSNAAQSRNPKIFRQNSTLFVIIAHLPGSREFRNKKFGTRFNLVHSKNNRNFAAMFNVMSTKKKLCRKNFHGYHSMKMSFQWIWSERWSIYSHHMVEAYLISTLSP